MITPSEVLVVLVSLKSPWPLSVAALLSFVLQGTLDPSPVTVFQAGELGAIRASAAFPPGGFPTVQYRDQQGHLLLQVTLGRADPTLWQIQAPEPDTDRALEDVGPRRLVSLAVPNQDRAKDAVLSVAMYGGGSDCEYIPTVVGVTGGHLKRWLMEEPVVHAQGGLFLGDLGRGKGFGLAAWDFLWHDGAHYGKHAYNVRLYNIDPSSGSARLILNRDTARKYTQGREALRELGLAYPDMRLRSDKLGC